MVTVGRGVLVEGFNGSTAWPTISDMVDSEMTRGAVFSGSQWRASMKSPQA